ncbi:hydroxyethylthiazole kinase [Thermincola potens]|uniref:Hydroxyethylthiazole kinase n=1 Tax=Thermincola potens (strain JR) TaxID=635013 RepID=D5XCG7_THEPJ|nr:hydroxyethylthiazole kinase [Thermincola potens]ADG81593.1 Hydroxyethylthiazole kinase [Thermincola potens JR]
MQEKLKYLNSSQVAGFLARVRREKPLIHHITNYVTANDCANITLHTGGLPVMAHAFDEVEEMVEAARALVLNIGTLQPDQVAAMIKAGKKANRLGIPVLLDPVGAGATKLRTESARKILSEVKVSVVKGNYAEIAILAGTEAEIRGVDAAGTVEDIDRIAREFAAARDVTVVVTGVTDIVTDGRTGYKISNGHELMGTITGTGCMAGSVIGCFLALQDSPVHEAAAALVCYGIAGEIAAGRADVYGPASFRTAFFDSLYNLQEKQISRMAKFAAY